MVNIDDLKADFLNTEFDSRDFVLSRDNLVTAATSSGETRPEFTDPEHPDFQATPAFLCSLGSGRHLPIDFPALGGVPMDGGKAVECFAPVRRIPLDRTHPSARHLRQERPLRPHDFYCGAHGGIQRRR